MISIIDYRTALGYLFKQKELIVFIAAQKTGKAIVKKL
jgi:hypothetical protein